MKTFAQFLSESNSNLSLSKCNENIIVPNNTREINVTAKDLLKIKNNRKAEENLFLWTDDKKKEYTIDDLYFIYKTHDKDDKKIKLYATDLSDAGREEFVDGFNDSAPSWYDSESDGESSDPWCAPWTSQGKKDWFFPKMSPYDMGVKWLKKVKNEMQEYFE